MTVSVSFLRDHFYMYIVSVLKKNLFSISFSMSLTDINHFCISLGFSYWNITGCVQYGSVVSSMGALCPVWECCVQYGSVVLCLCPVWECCVQYGSVVLCPLWECCVVLVSSMGVTAEMLRPFLEGWTLKQIIDAKRLFLVDMKILEKIRTKDDRPVNQNLPCLSFHRCHVVK